MNNAKTKVRIFSIGLTSVLIMVGLSSLIRFDVIQDYNTIQVLIFATFMAGLVFLFSIYAGLVIIVEGLLLRWGNKVFEAQKTKDVWEAAQKTHYDALKKKHDDAS